MPFAKLTQTTLYYDDIGKGEVLVFVHGDGDSHAMFTPQVQAFSPAYRVICPDLRGNGQSGTVSGANSRILDRQTDDLAFLLSDLDLDRVVLCGVSYGGVFALHFALRHPDWLAGLVIVDGFSDTKAHSIGELGRNLWQYASLIGMYLPRSWHGSRARTRYAQWPAAQEYEMLTAEEMRTHEAVLQRLASLRVDLTPRLGRIGCPTLGIAGDGSPWCVSRMQMAMQAIPGAKLEIIHNAIDPTHLCQVEEFNKLLAGFLNNINYS